MAIVDGRNSARTYGVAVPRFEWDFERIGPDREFAGRFMRSSKEAMVRRNKKVGVKSKCDCVPLYHKSNTHKQQTSCGVTFCDMLTLL